MKLKRVRARESGVTGYINCMRGTWLGNPFPLSHYSRPESLMLYWKYLEWRVSHDEKFFFYLKELGERAEKEEIRLGCTCKLEEACHVDLLITMIMKIGDIDYASKIHRSHRRFL